MDLGTVNGSSILVMDKIAAWVISIGTNGLRLEGGCMTSFVGRMGGLAYSSFGGVFVCYFSGIKRLCTLVAYFLISLLFSARCFAAVNLSANCLSMYPLKLSVQKRLYWIQPIRFSLGCSM